MQLALTPEVLFPLVAGAAVAIAVIAIIVALGRKKRTAADGPAGDVTAADWTGEAAAGDPSAAVASRVAIVGPHRLTVAEAVAVRDADTTPLPVSSSALLGGAPAPGGPASAAPVAAVPASGESGTPAATPSDDGSASPEPAPPAAVPSPSGTQQAPDPRPASTSSGPGPGPTVAAAVAQALAARAAAREVPAVTVPAAPLRAEDARDRLLAVLLEDPERAVGAVEELKARRGQLGGVLERLVASGLSVDQLARLSGFPADEVRRLLAQHQRLG